MKENDPVKGLWPAVVILLAGMTTGFILLSLVYTGPVWVKVVVFVIYLVVAAGLVTGVKRFTDKAWKDRQD